MFIAVALTLVNHVHTDYLEDNIFTRTLVNKRNTDHILNAKDLAEAKEILISKFNLNAVVPAKDSLAYIALVEKNSFDMQLYEYVRFLYDYQGRVLFGVIE